MSLEDILVYICTKYPMPHELSKARLTKMVYLADWEASLRDGHQISPIRWYFNNFGPYVDDVIRTAQTSSRLEVVETENLYGEPKQLIRATTKQAAQNVDRRAQEVLDKVIEDTRKLYWSDFIRHVYATRPIAESNRYSELDLEKFARAERSGN